MNLGEIQIKIKLSSKKNLEIFISKQKELTKVIEAISELLPFFWSNVEISEFSKDYYVLTGKDELGKIAVLNTIIEEIADLYLGFSSNPDFYI